MKTIKKTPPIGFSSAQKFSDGGRVPPQRFALRPEVEVIGHPDCPLIHRWTFADVGFAKLMLHHFLPNSQDRDPHDHPRPFLTIVLRGGYIDEHPTKPGRMGRDFLDAPTLRYRSAEHTHKTFTDGRGAWTIVIMGPIKRRWGFWREGKWWPWRKYEDEFGHGFRCEDFEA